VGGAGVGDGNGVRVAEGAGVGEDVGTAVGEGAGGNGVDVAASVAVCVGREPGDGVAVSAGGSTVLANVGRRPSSVDKEPQATVANHSTSAHAAPHALPGTAPLTP
jgi:hypothetical protein